MLYVSFVGPPHEWLRRKGSYQGGSIRQRKQSNEEGGHGIRQHILYMAPAISVNIMYGTEAEHRGSILALVVVAIGEATGEDIGEDKGVADDEVMLCCTGDDAV